MKKLTSIFTSFLALIAIAFSGNILAETKTESVKTTQTQIEQVSTTDKAKNAVIISDKVNINTATASEIRKAMVGIGTKKAEAIIDYREKHGNFTTLEQLLEVQGIGKATLEKNRDRITLE